MGPREATTAAGPRRAQPSGTPDAPARERDPRPRARDRVRLPDVSRPPGGDHPPRGRRRRRAGADAHRRRQEPVLPDSRRSSVPGAGIVVSPLIALMQDQVEALHEAGVAATLINSTLTPAVARERERALAAGRFDLVYVSPERLSDRVVPRAARAFAARAVRHRRGPLREPVGPRLPSRVPRPRRAGAPFPAGAAHRAHRHRRRADAARDPRAPEPAARRPLRRRLRSSQHPLRGGGRRPTRRGSCSPSCARVTTARRASSTA